MSTSSCCFALLYECVLYIVDVKMSSGKKTYCLFISLYIWKCSAWSDEKTKQESWHFCVLLYICNLKPKDANFIPRKLLKVEFFFLQNFGGEGYWWRLVCPHIYTNNTEYSFCLVTQGVNGTSTIIAYWLIDLIVMKPIFLNWGKVWAT